jgi:hypothetical protein
LRPCIVAGARETEEARKKELATVKDQVTTIKERTTEVLRGNVVSIIARLLEVPRLVDEHVSKVA